MRRQQWLQRNQAVQVLNAYAEAINPAGKRETARTPASNAQQVSGDDLFQMMGAKVKRANHG